MGSRKARGVQDNGAISASRSSQIVLRVLACRHVRALEPPAERGGVGDCVGHGPAHVFIENARNDVLVR